MRMKSTTGASRGAGVLLHVTSLPSPFGIGDLGPSSFAFVDYLRKGKQKYWQLLPLNPTGKAQSYSPYSSISSMAGNSMLISPEKLVEDGLLKKGDLDQFRTDSRMRADFKHAEKSRAKLLGLAFRNFSRKKEDENFRAYCDQESKWLDDFAAFIVVRNANGGKAWNQWPDDLKNRKKSTLRRLLKEHSDEVRRIQWEQCVFSTQWQELKAHCASNGISLIGDVPFYISYDSADVWSNREIFALDRNGRQTGVAGVPPDYFNADGQLWGMPVFRWDVLKKRKYDWWIERIRKNIELYDLVRLDHFRAFADYWEVPAKQTTARNGEWKPGPGQMILSAFRKEFGELPFIAEDLGDINQAVHKLRDKNGFPGMRILQFAFGDNMAKSEHIPHNFIENCVAYTGTHDNNTTRGWFRKDAGRTERKNLNEYTGRGINQKNVHTELMRLVYGSVARIAIVPMQDVLGLDETARMNTPASVGKNWQWRMNPVAMDQSWKVLARCAELYNRT